VPEQSSFPVQVVCARVVIGCGLEYRELARVLGGAELKCVQPRTLTHMDEHTFNGLGRGQGLPEWAGSGSLAAEVAVMCAAGPVKRGSSRVGRYQFC
jgi:hypothetical protein